MKYAVNDPAEFNVAAMAALRTLGIRTPLQPQHNSLERSIELLDLLDAWVQRQRLRVAGTGATATLSTDHRRFRRYLTSFTPTLRDVTVLAARDRALQAAELLDGVKDGHPSKRAHLLLLAACRVIEAAVMTRQKAAPDLVAVTSAGPTHAPAKQVLLNHALTVVTRAADRLVTLGAKATAS